MRKLLLILLTFIAYSPVLISQHIYPVAKYTSEINDPELSNFDIQDTVLYLPLGIHGLKLLNIKNINDIREISDYVEFEKRSRKKIYGVAHCVKVVDNRVYLSYGPLGLKILDVSDPDMPFVLGTYYRYQDVYCSEIYGNFALLGYIGMGLEIIDFSNTEDIKLVSRNNERDFTVKNIQVIPPYVVISGGDRGLRSFKFEEPFTAFKQAEFPQKYLTNNDANKIIVKGKTGYIANDSKGLTICNMGLPLYPLEVNNIKTEGKATEVMIDGDFLYVAGPRFIEVFDITDPEKPSKTFDHIDKNKDFISLKKHGDYLYALYRDGSKDYGFIIFQVE